MSENEPQDSKEWEAFADKKYEEIKQAIKNIETKGSSQSLEQNIRDAVKGFGDMIISLGALTYGVTSEVAKKATGEDAVALQRDLAKKTSAARNVIADELDKVSQLLRAKEEESEKKESTSDTSEVSDIT